MKRFLIGLRPERLDLYRKSIRIVFLFSLFSLNVDPAVAENSQAQDQFQNEPRRPSPMPDFNSSDQVWHLETLLTEKDGSLVRIRTNQETGETMVYVNGMMKERGLSGHDHYLGQSRQRGGEIAAERDLWLWE